MLVELIGDEVEFLRSCRRVGKLRFDGFRRFWRKIESVDKILNACCPRTQFAPKRNGGGDFVLHGNQLCGAGCIVQCDCQSAGPGFGRCKKFRGEEVRYPVAGGIASYLSINGFPAPKTGSHGAVFKCSGLVRRFALHKHAFEILDTESSSLLVCENRTVSGKPRDDQFVAAPLCAVNQKQKSKPRTLISVMK